MNYKKRGKIYLTTDTHFNHANMVVYCGRPSNFDELIWKGFKELKEDDTLIHLGDFCFGNDTETHFKFMGIVKCKTVLVKGNHDRKSDSWYLSHGWDFVCEQFVNTYFGKKILFSHEPKKDLGGCDLNIYGHFHNNLDRLLRKEWVTEREEERNKGVIDILTDKHKLLALEFVDYKLTSLENFIYTPFGLGKRLDK